MDDVDLLPPRERLRIGDQLCQRGTIHDFLLDQSLRQRVEDQPLRAQGLADPAVGGPEELLDLRVDPARGLLAVLALSHRRDVEEKCLAWRLERRETERLAHPVAGDHVARHVGGPLEVVLSPCRDIPEDEFFRDTAAEQHVEPVQELGAGHEISILGRLLLRVAERRRRRAG